MSESLNWLRFDVHGVAVGMRCDPALTAAIGSRFGAFAPPDRPDDVTIEFIPVEDVRAGVDVVPDRGCSVYSSEIGDVRYDEAADRLDVVCGDRARVRCDPALGRVVVTYRCDDTSNAWLLSHPLVTLPLIEILKRRGRYSLHAAGAALHERAVLFPGTSGAGKSTLALALLRAGFGYLSDDMLFLARREQGVAALAFPEDVDLTDRTLELFPELPVNTSQAVEPGWPKRQLRARQHFGAGVAWACRPVALVFPRVAHAERTRLIPLDRDAALLELAPNVLLTEPRSSQQHLDALADLAQACACYRMETGHDFDRIGDMMRDLLG